MNSKSQLQMPSFVGNPSSPALCFPATKTTKIERQQTTLCGCQKAPKSRCISAIGKQFSFKINNFKYLHRNQEIKQRDFTRTRN